MPCHGCCRGWGWAFPWCEPSSFFKLDASRLLSAASWMYVVLEMAAGAGAGAGAGRGINGIIFAFLSRSSPWSCFVPLPLRGCGFVWVGALCGRGDYTCGAPVLPRRVFLVFLVPLVPSRILADAIDARVPSLPSLLLCQFFVSRFPHLSTDRLFVFLLICRAIHLG
ncbi:hypothetical protein B0H16DRAFT_391326 [Mycena metata]|uniref:Uncharacterized protein n=1 Tax=Mycena metata TaxID=1033252 RepID=A0AAD7MJ85_9AGAR|nr:hypothetical protein B0H16DRAFT_391326 [Mycena metata]